MTEKINFTDLAIGSHFKLPSGKLKYIKVADLKFVPANCINRASNHLIRAWWNTQVILIK